MINYLELFNDSYDRATAAGNNNDDFFKVFYEKFMASSPIVKEKFKNTDMTRQRLMLKKSFFYMINFFVTKETSDYLENIANTHSKSQMDISPELYEIWQDSLIATVKEFDRKFDPDIELAWRVVFSPGITLMKFHYDLMN